MVGVPTPLNPFSREPPAPSAAGRVLSGVAAPATPEASTEASNTENTRPQPHRNITKDTDEGSGGAWVRYESGI